MHCHRQDFRQKPPIFQAGVIVFDTTKWRDRSYNDKCLKYMQERRNVAPSVDQTVLKVVLSGRIHSLPDRYNHFCYPRRVALNLDLDAGSICYLEGAPKPWDALGAFLN